MIWLLFQQFPTLSISDPPPQEQFGLTANELKKIEALQETLHRLKQFVDTFPSDKKISVDDFSSRKKPNYSWNYGPANKILAVYAFRPVTSRIVSIVDYRFREFYQGADLFVDALTTRTEDVKKASKNTSVQDSLQKAVKTVDDAVDKSIKAICLWEPLTLEALQAGASSCLGRNQTEFTSCLLEIYQNQLKPYGEAFTLLEQIRLEVNICGDQLGPGGLKMHQIKKFEDVLMEDLMTFSEELNIEVNRKILILIYIFIYIYIYLYIYIMDWFLCLLLLAG